MFVLTYTVFLYLCNSLEIGQQLIDGNYNISLNVISNHIIESTFYTNNNSQSTSITIRSDDSNERANILVNNPWIVAENYVPSSITLENLIIDGNEKSMTNFVKINTDKPMQINIINCEINNFVTTEGAIFIQEEIKTFTVYNEDDPDKDQVTTYVDILDIANKDAFITINIVNSTFNNNINNESNGGVLSLNGHEFQVNINDCTFTNNEAKGWHKNGGCISWDRSSIPDELTNALETKKTEILQNGKEQIGPIYKNFNSSNETIEWKIDSQLNIKNSKFISNRGEDAAGVAFIIQTETFDEQIFKITTQNITYNINIIRDFELNSEHNEFYNNEAGQYGAVYRHVGYAEYQSLDSSSLTLKCMDQYYKLNIYGDIFINNTIPENENKTQSFAFGGGLASACSKVTVQDAIFINNFAKYGPALSIYAASSLIIDNCTFQENNGSFGTIYINGLLKDALDGYHANITNSIFQDNIANNDGAGILAIIITKLYIDACQFISNINRYYGTVSVQYFQSYNPMNVEVINCNFTDNIVESDDIIAGGAISAQRYDYEDDVYPLNCYHENQGKFDQDIESLTLLIDSCIFTNNSESAIGLRVVSAYINNSYFYDNKNTKSHGGAIQSIYSWFEVTQCQFVENKAQQTGGAISTSITTYTDQYSNWVLPNTQSGEICRIHIHNSEFIDNYAELGGAMFIGSSLIIEENMFINNNGEYGGGLAISAYNMSIFKNQFVNNKAKAHGGCLFQTSYSNDGMSNIPESGKDVLMVMKQNIFENCTSYIGGAVFLRPVLNQEIVIQENQFNNSLANDVGGGLVIAQLLPISESSMIELANITISNSFIDNKGERAFDDFVSYPKQMYIKSENDDIYQVSPGIKTTAALGAYDIFGQDFMSFIVTDWNTREENFEFFLKPTSDSFELLTVNKGSLSAGRANISFKVETGNEGDATITILESNYNNLIIPMNKSWNLVECPSGYGYDINEETCTLCERDTFKVTDGWDQCLTCLDGLSCRGGEHVQILYKNWWDAQFSTSVKETFYCRLGECCTAADGCSPDSLDRCPNDRDPDSIGCGGCKSGYSVVHGSHICNDCTQLNNGEIATMAICFFVIWPIFLVFLFGLARYDGSAECKKFYSVSIIEITVILLIDYYQSLPAILTFIPDDGTYFLINLFFARIPITKSGLCLFDGMTFLDKNLWDLVLPSIILILSFIIFIISYIIGKIRKNKEYNIIKFGSSGLIYDPLRGIMFALFFTIIPMLWSTSHLFKCIDYGDQTIFWNAPGQECQEVIVALMAVFFVLLTLIYIVSNIFYSNSRLIDHGDIKANKKLIPLYLQRLQPFYFMVYPFEDQNSRRHSTTSMDLTWNLMTFRPKIEFKYLYVGWIAPFLRKITCLLAHATITGAKGQSDQTFIVTNLTLATLVLYQLFSQDYTSATNYTLHLYCIYLLYWLVLLIISGSTKIVSENQDTMQSLKKTVIVIMWIPTFVAVCAFIYAILLLKYPKLLQREKKQTDEQRRYTKAKTMNHNFHSSTALPGMDDDEDDDEDDHNDDDDQ